MPPVKVNVKWSNGRTTFDKLELDVIEPPTLFKAQLMTLTNVPIERQKLMFKGNVIKDETWPDKIEFNDGDTLMLMGSGEKLPDAPVQKAKFVEDMDQSELATVSNLPTGLVNLGNTCYISAVVQCLRTIPELCEALKLFKDSNSYRQLGSADDNQNENVVVSLREVYNLMDKKYGHVEPIVLVRLLHLAIPRFAQKGEGGHFQQQDANECWTELTRILQQNLKNLNPESKYSNFIDEYLSGSLEIDMKCDEAPDEPASKSTDSFLQLSCFISQDVRYMQAGLVSRMKETITKFSPSLERDATYTKTSRITRLPTYLVVQFVRFHYKGNVQTNAKLLRDVKFSMILDVFELCSESLQEKLKPMRALYKKSEDSEANSTDKESDKKQKEASKKAFYSNDKQALAKYSFPDDPGSNNSGFYELRAVLTHKGRSSSSGHYVGWIKQEGQWYKCDDSLVESIDEEEVLKLSGGGDWHCAYVLLYGPSYLSETST